jgi:hypothetical protein
VSSRMAAPGSTATRLLVPRSAMVMVVPFGIAL